MRIREIREELGLSQKELAEKMQVSPTNIYNYETGRTEPSIEILLKLSQILNVSIDYLIGREDDFGVVKNHAAVQGGEILSAEEKELIRNYRKLTDEQKLAVKMIASTYLKSSSESDKKQSRIK